MQHIFNFHSRMDGRQISLAVIAEAYLSSIHPGVEVEDVLRHTGWRLRAADEVRTTPAPSAEELQAIREYDKDGFWTR